jgi:SAM-dependent methyltransferase
MRASESCPFRSSRNFPPKELFMKSPFVPGPVLLRMFMGVAAAAIVGTAYPQSPAQKDEFVPQVGQAGKDVIWVPTPEELVERMLRMAQATPKDFVIDLGSGDGRIAIAAAKKIGARAMGIEYNPDMVALSNKSARAQGVANKVKFIKADIFETDFSEATIITMYLLPGLNLKLRPKLLEMKPGTRVVSHQFNMDDWEPDERTSLEGRLAFLWIVPAKVQGTWQLSANGQTRDLVLAQQYQKINGYIKIGVLEAGLRDATLHGDQIAFAWVDNAGVRHDFSGRVAGGRMEGTVRFGDGRAEGHWTAVQQH